MADASRCSMSGAFAAARIKPAAATVDMQAGPRNRGWLRAKVRSGGGASGAPVRHVRSPARTEWESEAMEATARAMPDPGPKTRGLGSRIGELLLNGRPIEGMILSSSDRILNLALPPDFPPGPLRLSTVAGSAIEKNLTLDHALRLQSELERQGVRVVLTRSDDREVPPEARAELANRLNADLVLAIHFDGYVDPHARGATAFCTARISTCMRLPRPAPSTNIAIAICQYAVSSPICDSPNNAIVASADPTIGKVL